MARRAVSLVMPTEVGIHDYDAARKKYVDGGPSPAMTGWAWSVPHSKQLFFGVAKVPKAHSASLLTVLSWTIEVEG